MENLGTVTYGAPINKYAQNTPFTDGVSSFFQIFNDFFKRNLKYQHDFYEIKNI
jgi:hypothetical protein